MTAEGFASRLRRARIVRVLLAYLAASWLLLQVTSLFVNELRPLVEQERGALRRLEGLKAALSAP